MWYFDHIDIPETAYNIYFELELELATNFSKLTIGVLEAWEHIERHRNILPLIWIEEEEKEEVTGCFSTTSLMNQGLTLISDPQVFIDK